ncbi:PU1, partial [Symbiodinium natans]
MAQRCVVAVFYTLQTAGQPFRWPRAWWRCRRCFRPRGDLADPRRREGVRREPLSSGLWPPPSSSCPGRGFRPPLSPAAGRVSAPRTCGPDGVWRLLGPHVWRGRYYTYRIRAYHPTTGNIETMETPDPYSHACSADAGRSLICHLPPWELGPEEVPQLDHRADAVIYELHVRDFSARDPTVEPALRGKYLAFEQEGTSGDLHLRRLADAGLTHVHLLPTYDFGSVPERVADRSEPRVNEHAAPDSEEQQAAVMSVADRDSFNWGYDPVLYGVPEGSYATNPDGLARVEEHRRMVAALHRKGLRVVADVVFNHVLASGPESSRSVLDKCVPGYYLRRSEDGRVEHSTCMNNTATERYMMERLVVDMVRRWAVEHRVDGFRFDLMGHVALQCMKRCRATLDSLTLAEHGIDGERLLLYGEGWEFGEVAGGARGPTGCQRFLAGTGIASFNDHLRDAILGGSPFEDPRLQGFATGQGLRPFPEDQGLDQGSPQEQMKKLKVAADTIRVCLASGLRAFVLEEDCFGRRHVPASEVHGGRAAYVVSPAEVVNFICVHDNETLYDSTVWKLSPWIATPCERIRSNWLCTAFLALGHGVPLFHA